MNLQKQKLYLLRGELKRKSVVTKTLCNRRPYENFEKIPVNNLPAVENIKSNEIPPPNKENEAEKHWPSQPKSFAQTTQNDSICESLLNCVSYVHKYSLGNLSCVRTWKHAQRDCNWTRTQNHLVLKRRINHLAKLACAQRAQRAYVLTCQCASRACVYT